LLSQVTFDTPKNKIKNGCTYCRVCLIIMTIVFSVDFDGCVDLLEVPLGDWTFPLAILQNLGYAQFRITQFRVT